MRALAILALLGGCGVLLPPGGPPTRAPVLVVMHRFGCLGPCADYELTVYTDGVVQYEGNANVHVHGKRTTTIGAAGAELLRRELDGADFPHLARSYTSGVDDVWGISWLIYRGKRVEFEVGYEPAPWPLQYIATEIEVLSHSDRWVSGPDPSRSDRMP
jgi:hypothetical protein